MLKFYFYFSILAVCRATLNVQDKMYVRLDARNPCVTRLNGSQSFGCSSTRGGNVGVIHLAYDESSLNWVLKTPKVNSYIVTLPITSFTFDNLKKLNDSENVKGVFVIQREKSLNMKSFSPEDRCPNRYSGLAGPNHREPVCDPSHPWNIDGNNMMMHKWSMPIFFSDDPKTVQEVEDCYKKFNVPLDTQTDRALCALELSSHMLGSVDSTTCLRRSIPRYNVNSVKYCDVMGNKNLYGPIISFDEFKKRGNGSYIFVTARLDSTSFFYGRASGALSTATSVVTLLLTADLLFRLMDGKDHPSKKNVMFIFFNGEAYDYIGSSRMVYDMEQKQFPSKEKSITLDDIGLFIELSQMMNDVPLRYHIHLNESADTNNVVSDFIRSLKDTAKSYKSNLSLEKVLRQEFPPSSYQSFLARKAISGVVFASYRTQFQNKYYHSLYDDSSNLGYKYANGNGTVIEKNSLPAFVADFSTILAHTLFEEITGVKADPKMNNTYELADERLHCFVETVNCKFFTELGISGYSPLDYYVGVERLNTFMTEAISISFVHAMGRKLNDVSSQEECYARKRAGYKVLWFGNPKQCFQTTVNESEAISPAFIISEYKLEEGVYSSWTESSWQEPNVRMFLKPSSKYEWLVLIVGVSVMVTSFLILYWVNRNARELFNYPHLMSASNI